MDLGLTLLQAKIYLTLCQTGTASVKTLSNASNTARQDIYRIMPTLQKLGLAEKKLTTPTMYAPIPTKNGFTLLLQKETEKYIELQNKTSALIKSLNVSNNKKKLDNKNTGLFITSSFNILFKRFEEGIDRAQVSLDICGIQIGIQRTFFLNLSSFKSAINRGVKIRVITEKQDINKSMENIIQTSKTSKFFEIRFISRKSLINTMIIDGKEMNFCLTTKPGINDGVPSLWTGNPELVKVVTAYFEQQWMRANREVS